ncbi:MAG: beta-lactamase family protein, partial [Clostridia bacterium]|nr:beta-lactamase family protein [Clostridia bacterium]
MKKQLIALLLTSTLFLGGCSMLPFGNESQASSEITSEVNEVKTVLDKNVLTKNIDEIAKYDFDNNKVFGSAYFVYDNGETIEKCYGSTSLTSNEAITNTTLFRLASMTKPITAVATLVAMEKGLLSLDDPIDKYLPEFKNIKIRTASGQTTSPKKMPTIMNILTHTSGIGSDSTKLAQMTQADKLTLDASIAFYVGSGLDFEPGTQQV